MRFATQLKTRRADRSPNLSDPGCLVDSVKKKETSWDVFSCNTKFYIIGIYFPQKPSDKKRHKPNLPILDVFKFATRQRERIIMEQEKRESLLRKLEALLNKTEANGCTEEEALSAMKAAEALMELHGISLAEIRTMQPNDCQDRIITFGQSPHEVRLCLGAIAEFTNTKSWWHPSRKPPEYCFIGLPADVDIARTVFIVFQRSIDSCWKVYWKENKYSYSYKHGYYKIRRSFREGVSFRLGERVRTIIEKRKTRHAHDNNAKAIVVAKEAIAEKAYEIYAEQHGFTDWKPRSGRFRTNWDAHEAGREAADEINIADGYLA